MSTVRARGLRSKLVFVGVVARALVACGPSTSPAVTPHPPAAASSSAPALTDRSGFEGKKVEPYHSDRFGLTLPLPDLPGWAIVDRSDKSGGWLVATHAATATVLRARKLETTSLVGRAECVARATTNGELPREDVRAAKYQTFADEPLRRPKGWDGWRWVAFEPGPGGAIVGHVFLVSGHQNACLIVHVIASAPSDLEVNTLADRLELFSSRVIGNVSVDRAMIPPMLPPMLPPTTP